MNRRSILAAFAAAALAAGAATAAGAVATVERESVTITGVFKYERGDVIAYKCLEGICRDTLVRDRYLQEHGAELFGKDITIRVTRIDGCHDPRSTRYACQTSLKDTVLLILEWIHPRSGP